MDVVVTVSIDSPPLKEKGKIKPSTRYRLESYTSVMTGESHFKVEISITLNLHFFSYRLLNRYNDKFIFFSVTIFPYLDVSSVGRRKGRFITKRFLVIILC